MTEQPPSKNWDPVKHTLFANLVGGSTSLPPTSRKGGGVHIMIDSRTYQKQRILLSARQKSSNYLEPSKENVLGKYAATLSMFYLKFFMIWFQKIFKLTFQTQPLCPRNICTGHWKKPANLTAFLQISYTLRTAILQNMCKQFW